MALICAHCGEDIRGLASVPLGDRSVPVCRTDDPQRPDCLARVEAGEPLGALVTEISKPRGVADIRA